jgi:hypothetical protein
MPCFWFNCLNFVSNLWNWLVMSLMASYSSFWETSLAFGYGCVGVFSFFSVFLYVLCSVKKCQSEWEIWLTCDKPSHRLGSMKNFFVKGYSLIKKEWPSYKINTCLAIYGWWFFEERVLDHNFTHNAPLLKWQLTYHAKLRLY